MSEHQPSPGEPGRAEPDDAIEAELIRKVLRTQERHREGGVDPELREGAPASEASGGEASTSEASGGEGDTGQASGGGASGGQTSGGGASGGETSGGQTSGGEADDTEHSVG